MAWYSYTLAFAIPGGQLEIDTDIPKLLNSSFESANGIFVHTSSRNGCLLWRLGCICELTLNGKNLYLLKDESLLDPVAVKKSIEQINGLIQEIENNPAIVVEATKTEYQPTLILQTEGFEPLSAEVVYPDDVIIKDGWVYNYTEEKVLQLLEQSNSSNCPCPDGDDDGESLEYVFNFLKSHLSLLEHAMQSEMHVVYGEMNR